MAVEAILNSPEDQPKVRDAQYKADELETDIKKAEKEIILEKTEREGKKELTDVEEVAKKLGWRPKEEFNEEPENYVDAETYILRTKDIQDTMKGHLKDQRRQIKDLVSSVEDIKLHNKKVYKAEIAKLKEKVNDLKTKKNEAIED